MTDHRKAFEDAIKENPHDSSPRLIFADWLEENGFDDESQEQRRRSTKEWMDADKWMHEFASMCGSTCRNYNEIWDTYFEEIHGLNWNREEDREEYQRASIRAHEKKIVSPITYEECIQAGHNYLNYECIQAGPGYLNYERYLTQLGSETARDLMSNKRIASEFWKNWSIITGIEVNQEIKSGEHGSAPFSFSC